MYELVAESLLPREYAQMGGERDSSSDTSEIAKALRKRTDQVPG